MNSETPEYEQKLATNVNPVDCIFYWFRTTTLKYEPYRYIQCRQVIQLLLLLSGVEHNPGPYTPKYPCMVCTKAVKWGQHALACDKCDRWVHTPCISMATTEYNHLANTSTTWICNVCNTPNHSTIYKSVSADENIFDSLNTTPGDTSTSCSISSIGSPCASSSPKKDLHPKPVDRPRPKLRTLVVNFQSIRNKVPETQVLIEDADPDIIVGTETWLNSEIFSSEVLPSNYNVFRRDRKDSYGGILIAVKTDLVCTPVYNSKDYELLAAKLKISKTKSVLIAALYRPPNCTAEIDARNTVEELTKLRTDHPKCDFWIAGDFNLPDVNWKSLSTTSHQNPQCMSQEYINIPSHCGVEQIVNMPTRGENILDLFFTSHPGLIDKCKTIPGVGDHDAVLIDTQCKPQRAKPTRRRIYSWDKGNITKLKEDTTSFVSTFIKSKYQNMDSCWTTFRDEMIRLMDTNIPHKLTRSRHTNPWMNTETRRLSRRKERAYRKASHTKNARDIRRYRHLKAECQREIRLAHRNYVNNIISPEAKQNPKKFWSFVKSKKQEASGVAPLRNLDGLVHSDPETKANILNNQFMSVFTREDTNTIPDKGPSPYSAMPHIVVGQNGVEKLLKNLNAHKATGPDSISTRLLKELATELAPALTFIFQTSLDSGIVPHDWRMAHVVPVFKKGDKCSAANYRPVSLTSVCSKVMEHILHSQIMNHLEQHSILTPAQYGFRSKRSCETQLLATIQDLTSGLSDGLQIDAILLDFAKAFDKVPHTRLLMKLDYYGIRNCTIKWIQSFLEDRKQHVLVEGKASAEADVVSGVPQGTVMGPLLFLVFINDLPETVNSTVKLFADDCLIYRPIKSARDSAILQEDLDHLEKWEKDWQMAFHPQKCTTIHISKRKNPIKIDYKLHNHTLESVPGGKYLGIYISQDLSWKDHINQTAAKAIRSVGFLRRNLRHCPQEVRRQAYTTLVRPVLEYGSSVWDPHQQDNIKRLESVQRQAARFVSGDYRSREPGCVSNMLDHLNWEPLQHRRARNRVVMLYKIINNIVEVPIQHLLQTQNTKTRGSSANNIRQIRTRLDIYKYSFVPATIISWNTIPPDIRASPTVEQFQHALTDISVLTLLHK